jgi:hypothetical protein
MKREYEIKLISGSFHLLFDDDSGICTSDLHCPKEDHDEASWNLYEGSIDSLESFILAAVLAGIDVESQSF